MAAVVGAAVCLASALSGHGTTGVGRWSAGLCFLLATLGMLGYLGRRLPLQNIAAVLLVAWTSAFLGLTFAIKSNAFFGALVYADGFGPKILGIVPWQVPLLWLALVLSSRETARLILRPWRRDQYYGYWLVGIAALLVLWTELALQPFALQVARWWSYAGAGPEFNWLGAPWVVFPTVFGLTVLVLGFVSPWLVAKRPIPTPPDTYPLAVWLLLNACFLFGNAWRGLWLPATATLLGAVAVVVLAQRARKVNPANANDLPRI